MPNKSPTKEKKSAKKVTEEVTITSKAKKLKARYSDSEVRSCTCTHSYQDEKYGTKKRVFNPCKKGQELRCSVCHREVRD